MNQNEKLDITLAKGLAITLVVIGHILAGGSSDGNEWFSRAVDYLYLFHMPFFMFISGYTFFKIGRVERLYSTYGHFIKSQAIRLLLPFLFMGSIIVAGKLVMQSMVHVDNVPDNMFIGFINLLWYTKESASVFLWYIFALFAYGVITPFAMHLLKNKITPLLIIAFVLCVAVGPIYYFYLDKLTFFYLFFVLGGAARYKEGAYTNVIKNKGTLAVSILFFLAGIYLFEYDILDKKYAKLFTGFACLPFLHQFCISFMNLKGMIMEAFLYVGRQSYIIYLFNTICIGITKGVIFLVMDWHYGNFFIVAPVLIAAGVLGPLIAEWMIFRRIPFIKNSILKT